MSGLVFSLVLGPVIMSALIKALRERPEFKELKKDQGWHGSLEEDGSPVEVFVKRDKKQIQFILPDRAIPEDICKKAIKKLTAELYAVIEDKPIDVDIIGPSRRFCHYCLEPAKQLLFRCERCGGFYCNSHRLPEEHDCPGGEKAGIKTGQKRETREEESEKEEETIRILLQEIPCG